MTSPLKTALAQLNASRLQETLKAKQHKESLEKLERKREETENLICSMIPASVVDKLRGSDCHGATAAARTCEVHCDVD